MLKRVLVTFVAACTLSATSLAFAAEQTHVKFTTTAGDFEIALDNEKRRRLWKISNSMSPINSMTIQHSTVSSGLYGAGRRLYGGYEPETDPPAGKNEADNGLRNLRGTIAMARTADKDSATSQFFINVADNAFLDHGQRDFGYAVFGKVVNGMEVVDKISKVKTENIGPYQNVPSTPIKIISATIVK